MPISIPLSAIASWMSRHEKALAAAAAACFLLNIVLQSMRPLWFDEIFTFYISRASSLEELFQALPADGNPPLNYLLTRLSLRLLGESELATRLPPILGFALAMLTTYIFIRRRSGAVAALFGLFIISTSGISNYAALARPYALLLGFTGLALVGWQRATEPDRPRLSALVWMAVGVAGAIGSHHYGIFQVGLPLAVGEAVRLATRRRIDFPLWLAGGVGLSAAAVTIPLALRTSHLMLAHTRTSSNFWAKPSLDRLGDYAQMARPGLILLFVISLCLTAIFVKATPVIERTRKTLPAHEIAAAAALALLLPVMLVVTWLAAGYFGSRYAIGTTMGMAILGGFAVDRFRGFRERGIVAASLCIVLFAVYSAGSRSAAYASALVRPPKPEPQLTLPPGDEPIVFCNSVMFLNTWQYSEPTLRMRLHYLADLSYALTQSDFVGEISLVVNQPILPVKIDDYQSFSTTHPRFLLYCGNGDQQTWLKDRLLATGWKLNLLEQAGEKSLFSAKAP